MKWGEEYIWLLLTFLFLCTTTFHFCCYYFYYYYIIIIIMNAIRITFISGSSSSNSIRRSIMIIIIIINSSSINKISVSLTMSTSIFELFICFLLFYIYIPHHLFFWESRMEIKLHSFFVLSLTLHLMENFFTTVFYFSKFTFVYVVNIRFICICDGETYLLTGLAHTNFVVTSQFTDKISYLKPLHS